jgi:hypothetical protein
LEHRPPTSQAIEKVDRSKTDEEPSDNPVVSGQESETSGPDREGEEKSTPEGLKSDLNEGTNQDLEGKSTENSSEQDNPSESKNE